MGEHPLPSGEIESLLEAWATGEAHALDALVEHLYVELRKLAHAYMRRERSDHSLQTTALINELYMRLARQRHPPTRSRAQFFGVAAHLMRRILVDYARARKFKKRNAGTARVSLEDAVVFSPERTAELLSLDEALSRLAAKDTRKAQVVELRYFGGLTVEEAALVLRVSPVTVHRDWQLARAWLRRELSDEG
jgi:RNA polymerase sigma factor (TIGR02999 family)